MMLKEPINTGLLLRGIEMKDIGIVLADCLARIKEINETIEKGGAEIDERRKEEVFKELSRIKDDLARA